MPYFTGGGNGQIYQAPDPGQAFLQAYTKAKTSSLLSDLYLGKPEDRASGLAKLFRLDRDAAFAAEDNLNRRDAKERDQFKADAGLVSALFRNQNNAYAQTAYSKLRDRAGRMLGGAQLPDELDANTASMLGSMGGQSQDPVRGVVIGNRLVNPTTGQPMYEAPEQPKYDLREVNGKLYYIPSSPMPGPQAQQQTQPQQPSMPQSGTAFDRLIGSLMQREGGYVADDAGAGPTNFGINSRANPDVDVRNLTPERAQQLYRERYWNAINADSLPVNLQNAAFDAAVNMGPQKARELLAASGGDPVVFDQLRRQHYEGLAQQNPAKYGPHLTGWLKRIAETRATPQQAGIGAGMGFGVAPQGGGYAPQASGLPAGAIPVAGLPDMPTQQRDPPSGYQWNPDGSQSPIPGGPADRRNNPTPADQAKGEMGMRKELQDLIKQDRTVLGMYKNVQNAAKAGTAASDLSMIFAYMKMLDPGSVVREQEFSNAQNAAGIPDRILNVRNQILNGNRLNPKQRQEFLNEARELANEAQSRITSQTREHQGIAEQYGYDTVRATGQADFRDVQSRPGGVSKIEGNRGAPGNTLKPGHVEDGYRYKGGDPGNPASWEAL